MMSNAKPQAAQLDSPGVEVFPDAHRAQANVDIAEADPEQAAPGPHAVAAIETTDAIIRRLAGAGLAEFVLASANEMTQRMATERVTAEQNHVDRQHD